MKKSPTITLVIITSLTLLPVACSSNEPADTRSNTVSNINTTNTAATSPAASTNAMSDDAPPDVRAALPEAQTFTTQRRDIPANAVASIEKDTGASIVNPNHVSYLAFTTSNNVRRQVGAATVIEAGGQQIVIIYDSKNGMPVIREVRGGTFAPDFRSQFGGKGHDDALTLGKDIKATGTPEATARQVTTAIKTDVLTMQALYGAAHSH